MVDAEIEENTSKMEEAVDESDPFANISQANAEIPAEPEPVPEPVPEIKPVNNYKKNRKFFNAKNLGTC